MRPEYLVRGETSRLFPVLATTSKEGRTTSILLASLCRVDEFGREILKSVGQRLGKRTKFEAYTEIAFESVNKRPKDQPDGLIILSNGNRQWRAIIEAKVGNRLLDPEQIERYRALAKEHKIDCVITISNQFATRPENHPIEIVRRSRSKIPVFHWSWMSILTAADLLLTNNDVKFDDQIYLLSELRRFLSHEKRGCLWI